MDKHYEVMQRNRPEIVLNLFMHGLIERGLNCSNGGVDILDLNIDGIALTTVADSFAAIEQRVVEEKKLTWDRLFELLDTNYEGAERERLMLKNIRRFGSPGSLRPGLGSTHPGLLCSTVHKVLPTRKHHLMIVPGLFSHGDVYAYGKTLEQRPTAALQEMRFPILNRPRLCEVWIPFRRF